MTKRTRISVAYILLMFGCVCGIICAIFVPPLPFRIAVAAIVVPTAIIVLQASHCPFCGKYRVKIKPFSKENPACKKCGKEQPHQNPV